MSPFAIIAIVGVLGIGGYVAYDIYKTTTAPKSGLLTSILTTNLDGLDSPAGRVATTAEASSAEHYWNEFTSLF